MTIVRLIVEAETDDTREAVRKFLDLVPVMLANDIPEIEGVSIRFERVDGEELA